MKVQVLGKAIELAIDHCIPVKEVEKVHQPQYWLS